MWFFSPVSAQKAVSQPRRREERKARAYPKNRRRLQLEVLEDRLAPATVTILGSHLLSSAESPERYDVDGFLSLGTGDRSANLGPGTYSVQSDHGTYGTFTVTSQDTIGGTTGALVATANTIEFDLTKLAAVTVINDVLDSQGVQEAVNLKDIAGVSNTVTFYLPSGTYELRTYAETVYGSFNVADNGSGSLVVTATTGALVATGNSIDFDLTKLAAVTIKNDVLDSQGFQEAVNLKSVGGHPVSNTVTFYLPSGTYELRTYAETVYGSFTVADNGSGSLVVTATTGALVATGNSIDFDLTKLAAVTIKNDVLDSQGFQEAVNLKSVGGHGVSNTVTFYLPSGTYELRTYAETVYGSFTVADNGSGSLVVSATTGALVATGNTIDFEECALNNVTITPNPGVGWNINGVVGDSGTDTVHLPDGTYTISFSGATGGAGPATFSVGPSGLSETALPQSSPLVTLQLVGCQDPSMTTVAASVNSSLLNQSVAFTANVTPQAGSGTPTGTVQFVMDGVNFGSPVTLTNGSASISTATLTAGPHTIQAVYSGDTRFLSSTGSLTQSVQYNFIGFLRPLNSNLAFGLNRTIPIKFQLTDYNGNFITSLSAITSLQVLNSQGSNVFSNTGSTALRYDSNSNQFIANWQTKGLPAGTYRIVLSLADGTVKTKVVQLSANGAGGALLVDGTNARTTAVGALLGGNIELYVDNSNGDLTADELARIQDAVTAADAVTEPYGVAVQEVTDPTLADVTLNMDTTSAVGGYADGVLGCTTDAGQITLINGWNFYAGSDATQIGSAQYDFETVVTHELGHALGLGHSIDSTSVMYATLNAGAVNRSLTTADLNVADSDTTGACGLHAALTVGRISNPSYEDGRDMVFAMLAGDRARDSAGMLAGLVARDAVFTNGFACGAARQGASFAAASFGPKTSDPIFVAPLAREDEDSLLEVPLFPDPSQGIKGDANQPDASIAPMGDQSTDYVLADLAILP